MAQTTPTHASGFHLVTLAMTGHVEDKASTTAAHNSLKRCCPNAVSERRSRNMGLYRYDQWACLPDAVVVGYYPSAGYSELSSEAEPTTKDTTEHNHHMAICNNMMHAMTWQYEVSWLMHYETSWFESI